MQVTQQELKEYIVSCRFPDDFKFKMCIAIELYDLRREYEELERKYKAVKRALEVR